MVELVWRPPASIETQPPRFYGAGVTGMLGCSTPEQHCKQNRFSKQPLSPSPASSGTTTGKRGKESKWQVLQHPASLSHLVFRIIREGIGPRILSIMARCSRLS